MAAKHGLSSAPKLTPSRWDGVTWNDTVAWLPVTVSGRLTDERDIAHMAAAWGSHIGATLTTLGDDEVCILRGGT